MKAGRKRLQALILKRLIFLVHFVGDRKVPRSLLGTFSFGGHRKVQSVPYRMDSITATSHADEAGMG